MSDKGDEAKKALDLLNQLIVEDILAAPDDELTAEFKLQRGDPAAYAANMRKRFEANLIAMNKGRLKAARAALDRAAFDPPESPIVDMTAARRKLREVLASNKAVGQLTMAARNENELTDADISMLIADLRELGLWPESGDNS